MTIRHDLDPVVVRVTVPLGPEAAFELFTRQIAEWWPTESHSVTGSDATPVFEASPGGRIYEVGADGAEHAWGAVEMIDRPNRVTFTWHPGRKPETAQHVEVVFSPRGEQTTVTLTHSGWEVLGDRAQEIRNGYVTGWRLVLGERFGGRAGAPR